MLDKETFIKRETEVEERKILDWCGTMFKSMVGGIAVIVPLTTFFCINVRYFGIEGEIACLSALSLIFIIGIAIFLVFEFSNKIAYRKACKNWEKEHKIQEKRQKDEDRAIENFKFLMLLNTLKKKEIDIHNLLISETVEQYNSYAHRLGFNGNLTQKEFDLAKDILG